MQVNRCLSIKGAEDILNKPHAFEVSTTDDSMFFIADTDKVQYPTDHVQHIAYSMHAIASKVLAPLWSMHTFCLLREP